MLDHDQGLPLAHPADQFNRVGGLGAAHAGGGFIQQDHLCAAGDGDADFQRALLGIGEHACQVIAALFQSDGFHHFLGAQVGILQATQPVPEGVLVAERPEHGAADVFEYRHALEDIGDLEAARQALAIDFERLQADDAVAVEQDLAVRYRVASADQVEQRGLAGAIGADDGVALAARDAERNAVDDLRRAEAFLDFAQIDRGNAAAGSAISLHRCASPISCWIFPQRAPTNLLVAARAASPAASTMLNTIQGGVDFASNAMPARFIAVSRFSSEIR